MAGLAEVAINDDDAGGVLGGKEGAIIGKSISVVKGIGY
jgi:hypothetical protein